MKKIILFDPSHGTSNQGDLIINEAIMRQMNSVFTNNYLIRYSTHSPLMHLHQLLKRNFITRNCDEADLKFLGGSNIFKNNLLKYTLDWNVNIFTKGLYSPSISIGGGLEGSRLTVNRYTKFLYKRILSHSIAHSVRDNQTRLFIQSLGLKAINTGCPTLWDLTEDKCRNIPLDKSPSVVFTLTDYKKSPVLDKQLIKILNESYNEVFFWVQGTGDLEYLSTLCDLGGIKLVPPHLDAYKMLLEKGNIDYVGTRLHAGIYAMQHNIRSVILAIDNRTRDMKSDYGLNVIERLDIQNLPDLLNSAFATRVHIDSKAIEKWKGQFNEFK